MPRTCGSHDRHSISRPMRKPTAPSAQRQRQQPREGVRRSRRPWHPTWRACRRIRSTPCCAFARKAQTSTLQRQDSDVRIPMRQPANQSRASAPNWAAGATHRLFCEAGGGLATPAARARAAATSPATYAASAPAFTCLSFDFPYGARARSYVCTRYIGMYIIYP